MESLVQTNRQYLTDGGGILNEFEVEHYNRSLVHKQLLEQNMLDPLFEHNEDLNSNIEFEEISRIVMNAKSNSACGHDEIPYCVLKYPPVIRTIHELFQLVFDTSIIPSVWRKAIICPILKDASADKRMPMNYRGVSLLSCISKLYSALFNKRLVTYLENNDTLADEQNGFRRNRSCEDHIFTLNSVIKNNYSVFAAFIDLKKCFDFIERNMMLYKLLLNNINGKLYNSIKSVYHSSESCVRLNGKLTSWFSCKTGVKQGDNLSPTLLSIFINDFVSDINNLNLGIDLNGKSLSTLLYADDIVLLAKSPEDLQRMLDTLHAWCKRWRVLINTNKSKCVHFRNARARETTFEFSVGQNRLETVDSYKYLGIVFTYYSSSVWGFKKFPSIDTIQNRALRYFMGVHRFTPIVALHGDAGWLPSQLRRWISMARFWNRVLSFEEDRLTRVAFDLDYSLQVNNWCSDMKHIFSQLNMEDSFRSKSKINLETFRRKITEMHSVNWSDSVQTVSKLRTYRTFKTTFSQEKYLTINLSKVERSHLAQLRFGILPLRIETGRYIGKRPEDRLCRLCDERAVESEQHFLFECDFYQSIRQHAFGDLLNSTEYISMDLPAKLTYLMEEHSRTLSKYIVRAFDRRRSHIYR